MEQIAGPSKGGHPFCRAAVPRLRRRAQSSSLPCIAREKRLVFWCGSAPKPWR